MTALAATRFHNTPPESRGKKEKDYSLPNPTTPPTLRDRAGGRLQRCGNRRGARSGRAHSGRANRSCSSRSSGVGAAGRTSRPGDGGCERAGLDAHAAEVPVLGCGAAAGEAEHAQMPVCAVLWGLVSPYPEEEKAMDGNSGGKKDLRRKRWRKMDQRS